MLFISPEQNIAYIPDNYEESDQGLTIVGSNLNAQNLIYAYSHGLFPWGELDNYILWWSPDPRTVIFPNKIHFSRSLLKSVSKIQQDSQFQIKINQNFPDIIFNCGSTSRKLSQETWINQKIFDAYCQLNERGNINCAGLYYNNEIIGGLYGVRIGKIFFGESMFHKATNASKIAFYFLANYLIEEGCQLIDCQQDTNHLRTFASQNISRAEFLDIIKLGTKIANNNLEH